MCWMKLAMGVDVIRLWESECDGGYVVRLQPGASLPDESHASEEHITVLRGAAKIVIAGCEFILAVDGAAAGVASGVAHAVVNVSDGFATLLVVARPPFAGLPSIVDDRAARADDIDAVADWAFDAGRPMLRALRESAQRVRAGERVDLRAVLCGS